MSMRKAIENGKEHRKPYRKRAQRIDRTCRPGGSCPYCQGNRKHKHDKKLLSLKEQEDDVDLQKGS